MFQTPVHRFRLQLSVCLAVLSLAYSNVIFLEGILGRLIRIQTSKEPLAYLPPRLRGLSATACTFYTLLPTADVHADRKAGSPRLRSKWVGDWPWSGALSHDHMMLRQ